MGQLVETGAAVPKQLPYAHEFRTQPSSPTKANTAHKYGHMSAAHKNHANDLATIYSLTL